MRQATALEAGKGSAAAQAAEAGRPGVAACRRDWSRGSSAASVTTAVWRQSYQYDLQGDARKLTKLNGDAAERAAKQPGIQIISGSGSPATGGIP